MPGPCIGAPDKPLPSTHARATHCRRRRASQQKEAPGTRRARRHAALSSALRVHSFSSTPKTIPLQSRYDVQSRQGSLATAPPRAASAAGGARGDTTAAPHAPHPNHTAAVGPFTRSTNQNWPPAVRQGRKTHSHPSKVKERVISVMVVNTRSEQGRHGRRRISGQQRAAAPKLFGFCASLPIPARARRRHMSTPLPRRQSRQRGRPRPQSRWVAFRRPGATEPQPPWWRRRRYSRRSNARPGV